MSVGACFKCATAMARVAASPYCATQRVHSQSGVQRRGASSPLITFSPSRDTRRKTALISGLKCTALLSLAASRLAASTAAWGATFRIRSSQAPNSRISLAWPALCGCSGFAMNSRNNASSMPRWRSVWLASARAKPASRGLRPLRLSSCESSGRRWRNTPETMASAARRAGRPVSVMTGCLTQGRAQPQGPFRTGTASPPAIARKRATRSSVEGWLANRPDSPPCSGLMMNICAVAGLASAG